MSNDLCQHVEDNLGELMDFSELKETSPGGEVPANLAACLKHAERCSTCRESLASYRKTVALLHNLPDMPVPEDFLAWVRKRVAGSRPTGASLRLVWSSPVSLALAATLLLAVGLVVYFAFGGGGAPENGVELAARDPVSPQRPGDLLKEEPDWGAKDDRGLRGDFRSEIRRRLGKEIEGLDAELSEEGKVVDQLAREPVRGRTKRVEKREAARDLVTRVMSEKLADEEADTSLFEPVDETYDVALDASRFSSQLDRIEERLLAKLSATGVDKKNEGDTVLVAFRMPKDRLHLLRSELNRFRYVGEKRGGEKAALHSKPAATRSSELPKPSRRLSNSSASESSVRKKAGSPKKPHASSIRQAKGDAVKFLGKKAKGAEPPETANGIGSARDPGKGANRKGKIVVPTKRKIAKQPAEKPERPAEKVEPRAPSKKASRARSRPAEEAESKANLKRVASKPAELKEKSGFSRPLSPAATVRVEIRFRRR